MLMRNVIEVSNIVVSINQIMNSDIKNMTIGSNLGKRSRGGGGTVSNRDSNTSSSAPSISNSPTTNHNEQFHQLAALPDNAIKFSVIPAFAQSNYAPDVLGNMYTPNGIFITNHMIRTQSPATIMQTDFSVDRNMKMVDDTTVLMYRDHGDGNSAAGSSADTTSNNERTTVDKAQHPVSSRGLQKEEWGWYVDETDDTDLACS